MGSELGLDLKLFAVKSVTGFLKDASVVDDASARTARLEDYVRSLEEEKKKIEAFRRELPLSVLLITEVIRGLREELEQCRGEWHAGGRHALEEFMPMKDKFEEEGGVKPEKDTRDKMNWMSSAQLWTDHYNNDEDSSNDSNNDNAKRKPEERDDEADRRHESKITRMESKPRSGGAFRPFKATLINGLSARKEEKVASMMPDLSLVSRVIRSSSRPVSDVHDGDRCSAGAGTGAGTGSKAAGRAASAAGAHLGLQGQQQPPRKARRCWSPELHRRFVMVLQQLGGAQVATPKQIRELMKVDGLTNDEVKSHLQKYRLHTRRMPNSSSAMGNRSVVLVGGLWVAQDHYTTSQQSASQSGSPQGPLQLAGSTRTVSVTAGDSYEEEDGKSESYSWK